MSVCVCKRELAAGDRVVTISYHVDWGSDDERETTVAKAQPFCSFRCVADWAQGLAERWDGVVVHTPEESHQPARPVVDRDTDTLLRGAH